MAQENFFVTAGRAYKKALTANNNDSAFASKVPTLTEPTNDGVVPLSYPNGLTVPQYLWVLPYGLGSDNDAFSIRVIGWRHVGQAPPQGTWLWVPTVLCEMACTCSSAVGVAGTPVLNTERFCDTITVVHEPTVTADVTRQGTVLVFSPADNTVGWFAVELRGHEKFELTFDQTTNTPTMNALVSYF